MKKVFSISTILKLFFLTSLSTASPACTNSGAPAARPNSADVTVIHLTEASFKQLIFNYEKNKDWKYEGSKPAIIDFYADWCGPCKQLSPLIEEIAKEYKGKLIVYKIDTDKERMLSQKIGISALPTLMFIPLKGKPQVSMGALPKETLIKAINDVLLIK